MTLRWVLATIHLLALGIGLGAVWARSRALRTPLDTAGLRKVFTADTVWGVAAILWIATGVWRVFGGFEKGVQYYMGNPLFHAKMGVLLLILILEVRPMITLIRWRQRLGAGATADTTGASTLARISQVQALLIVLMVFLATGLARGLGF